jgi:hypothetical protein
MSHEIFFLVVDTYRGAFTVYNDVTSSNKKNE